MLFPFFTMAKLVRLVQGESDAFGHMNFVVASLNEPAINPYMSEEGLRVLRHAIGGLTEIFLSRTAPDDANAYFYLGGIKDAMEKCIPGTVTSFICFYGIDEEQAQRALSAQDS